MEPEFERNAVNHIVLWEIVTS